MQHCCLVVSPRLLSRVLIICSACPPYAGDAEFKTDLTDKICVVVEKFAPSKRWQIDTVLQVLAIAGSHTRESVASNLISLIARSKTLHPYAVFKAFRALQTMKTPEVRACWSAGVIVNCDDSRSNMWRVLIPCIGVQLALIHVGVWCVGEYGELLRSQDAVNAANVKDEGFVVVAESDVLDMLEQFLKSPVATVTTKSYVLNALVKLSTRMPSAAAYVFRVCCALAGWLTTMAYSFALQSYQESAIIIRLQHVHRATAALRRVLAAVGA